MIFRLTFSHLLYVMRSAGVDWTAIHCCRCTTTPLHSYSTVRYQTRAKPVVVIRQMLGLMTSVGVPSDNCVQLNELLGALDPSQTSTHRQYRLGDSNVGSTSAYCVRRELISGQLVSLLISSILIAYGNHWIS